MHSALQYPLWIPFTLAFVIPFIGFATLIWSQKTGQRWAKRLFHIPARKSSTNAVQLGGLPLSIGFLVSLISTLVIPELSVIFSAQELGVIKAWTMGASVIVFYGYLDDKFELRPIVKLIMQFLSVGLFSIMASHELFPQYSALSFLVLSFVGLGVVNGSNLLDGLDTLTIKLALASMVGQLVIGYNFQSLSALLISGCLMFPLLSFYFFNKEPAKIHLGEIGGSFVGFAGLLISSLIFARTQEMRISSIDGLAMAIFPLSLPMTELGVSFLRRIFNRKSPFSGDKYHIHHILRHYYEFSASAVASIMATFYVLDLIVALSITHHLGPLLGGVALFSLIIGQYFFVGKQHWVTDTSLDLSPTALFDSLRKKDIAVIHSMEVDEFEIFLVEGGEEKEQDDEKKAA